MDPKEKIAELQGRIQDLTPEELAELNTLLEAEFAKASEESTKAPTAENLAELQSLVDGLEAADGEGVRRAEQEAELARQHTEIMDRANARKASKEGEGETPAEGATSETDTDTDTGDEGLTDEEKAAKAKAKGTEKPEGGPVDAPAAEPEGSPLLASGARGEVEAPMSEKMAAVTGPAEPSPTGGQEGANASRGSATITAAAGLSRVGAGQVFESKAQLVEAMADQLTRIGNSRGDYHVESLVASSTWKFPEDRILTGDSVANAEKIQAVCGLEANRYDALTFTVTASGGICLPVNVDYSVPTWSTADRPLRDALPGFQADRGGIRFVAPPDIGVVSLQGGTASGFGAATGLWTEATDANPAGATKPVYVVPCGQEILTYVGAVTTRTQFGNMQSRFAPEQVAADMQQAIAAGAREAELNLLTLIANNSKQVKCGAYLGASRDILASLDLAKNKYAYPHRIARNAAWTVIYPEWVMDVIKVDLLREIGHDNAGPRDVLAISDAQVNDLFKARNINVIWTIDGLQAGTYGTGGTAITNQYFSLETSGLPQWPGQSGNAAFMAVGLFFVEGTIQFLDGGKLDLGVVRDSLLDSTNDYETFTEVFEGVAMRGLEVFQMQHTILPSGGTGGTVAVGSYGE